MEDKTEVAGHVFALPVEKIHRSPYQVRRDEKPDPDLKASIAAHGLVHPITVREDGKGGYELIAGHRRLASYREALPGAPIPATVLSVSDREAEDLLVSENFMRLDLSLIEKAVTIARLRDHGRSPAQVAELVRMSERTVFRFLAIGTLAAPWREFLHAWGATYEEALRLARLPSAVQISAWSALLGFLADELTYTVRKGNKKDEEARGLFIAALEGLSDDKAGFLDHLTRAGTPGDLPTAADAEALVRRWFEDGDGLAAFLGEQRLLDPKTCPFDCKSCKGCPKRSDVQRDLFDEDDPARVVPRCHDAECWARKAAEAKALDAAEDADAAADEDLNNSGEAVNSAPPDKGDAPTGAALTADGKAASGNLPTSSTPPRKDGVGTSAEPKSSGNSRGGVEPLSESDVGVRMGVVWTVSQLLHGDRLEDILPRIADLRADAVRRGGWLAHVRENALPRLVRNQEESRAALATLERMW